MNAATLTAIRADHNAGPDGDRVFVLSCQLGKCGEAARLAWETADAEVRANDHLSGHHADARVADRIVELIDQTDPAGFDRAAELDAESLALLHHDLTVTPDGALAFVITCLDGMVGDAAARAADSVLGEFSSLASDVDLQLAASRVLAAVTSEVAA